MSQYYHKDQLSWQETIVPSGARMEKCIIWEGDFDVRSAFFRMPKGTVNPSHTHTKWVQVMVLEGEMEIESVDDGVVQVAAGGCYFVEPGDSHKETALQDTLVLVTQAEDRPEFIRPTSQA